MKIYQKRFEILKNITYDIDMKEGFNTKKYLDSQTEKFKKALTSKPGKPAFLEFGGKPFSDLLT